MLVWNPSVLTTKGKALLAKAQAGKTTIAITKAQAGSGTYSSSEDLESKTALKNKVQEFPISSKTINNDSTLVLKIVMENSELTTGYNINEFGIFATDPDAGEILYSIATASTADYMPAYNGEVPSVINMSYYLEVANAASVTIKSAGALALQEDLLALETRVTNLEENTMKKYGVRRKTASSSSSAWERIGGSVGLTANAAVGNGTVANDFMESVYPYNKIIPVNVDEDLTVKAYLGDSDFQWDGSNGDVMVEIPKFYTDRYYQTDADGVEWEYRWIAAGPVDGLHVHPMFTDGDTVSEKVYLPIFNGSLNSDSTKLESKAGVFPLHNKTRAQFRALCTAKGSKWCLDDVWAMHALDQLFLVMFANSNAQAVLGSGRSEMYKSNHVALQTRTGNTITISTANASIYQVGWGICIGASAGSSSVAADRLITAIEESAEISDATVITFDGDPVTVTEGNCIWACCQPTGATTGMASANGRVEGTNGHTAVRFLYIEDWYGNGYQFRDGDNINKYQHYYCNKRSSYADTTYDGDYFAVDYVAATANGYVKRFGFDKTWPEIEIAVDTAAGSTTWFSDYYYCAEGGQVVFSGGNVGSGTPGGPFYRYCSSGVGHSDWYILGRPQGRK